MNKFLWILVFAVFIFVGCTSTEVLDNTEKGLFWTQTLSDFAGGSSMPIVGVVGGVASLLLNGIQGWRGTGNKKKLNSMYRATNSLHKDLKALGNSYKDGNIDADFIVDKFGTIVKKVSVVVHEVDGVKDAIKKDVNRLQEKGYLDKLS